MKPKRGWLLWLRWVLANSVAELIGLGATFAIGVGLFSELAESPGALPTILSAVLMTLSGVIEGTVVGLVQWWAMRPAFPALPRRSWVLATVIGALVAWFMGSMAMTAASLSVAGPQQTTQEPEAAAMLLLAGSMGGGAGLVLGFPQWRVLRRFAERAWLWLPANCVAWAVGMPLVFLAVDQAQKSGSPAGAVSVMAVALALTGAVVGAIHGVALVMLAQERRTSAA